MKTLTLSAMDIQIIVDALRLKHGVLVSQLLLPEEKPADAPPVEAPVAQDVPKYGLKKDGTPRKPPGRPRTRRK